MQKLEVIIQNASQQLARNGIPFVLIFSNPQIVPQSLNMISGVLPEAAKTMLRAVMRPGPKALEELTQMLNPNAEITPATVAVTAQLVDLILSKAGDAWSEATVEKASPLISV